MLSSNVTIEIHVDIFPQLSETVRVTGIFDEHPNPDELKSAQVNEVVEADRVTGEEQLSELPPSKLADKILELPDVSNCTVIS